MNRVKDLPSGPGAVDRVGPQAAVRLRGGAVQAAIVHRDHRPAARAGQGDDLAEGQGLALPSRRRTGP